MATARRVQHWMDGLPATRRSHAEDGGERTRRLGGANLTFGRALALDLEIVGQDLTSPSRRRFRIPKVLRNPQRPSVTRRDRSKLAPEVAARFLSFNSLLASVLASKSEVRSARAGATWRLTAARPARPRESALGRVRLLRRRRLGRGVDLRANTRSMCSIRQSTRSKTIHASSRTRARSFMHSFIHPPGALTTRVDALVASTRDPFVLSRSLSPPPLHRPIVTDRVVTDRASTPPIHRSCARGVSRGDHRARGMDERDVSTRRGTAFDRSGPRRT